MNHDDIKEITHAFIQFILFALFILIAPAAVYIDTVIFDHGIRESSLTEYTQETLLFISAALFFWLAYSNNKVRGFAILVGGFFGAMLIRELDSVFDQIIHGFWVYPAVAWTICMLLLAARFRQELVASMASATRSHAFVFIFLGLAIVLAFSRVFGTTALWQAVLADVTMAKAVKNTVQEGLELLGYLLIFRGTLGYLQETGQAQEEKDVIQPTPLPISDPIIIAEPAFTDSTAQSKAS